ncbi:MAG TPA: tetratricopeptide repeat protein [Polyangiales bacterium]
MLAFGAKRAHAQATARFADVPSETAAPVKISAPAAVRTAPPPTAAVTPARAVTQTPEPSASDAPVAAPQVGFTRRLALTHLERAEQFESRGDVAQALREYTECIAIDSTFGEAYLRLGVLRERMGEPREADIVYSAALGSSETRGRALVLRSHLRRAAGLNAEALGDLEAAIEVEPNRELLKELARDYVESHAWCAALAVFRRIAASAAADGDSAALDAARLEVRALRVLAAETDPSQARHPKHDWVGRALSSIARR